jgi:hypothetical protein
LPLLFEVVQRRPWLFALAWACISLVARGALTLPRARVYPANPISTPQLADVELALPAGSTVLANEQVVALTCIDRHDVRDTAYGAKHVCHLEPVAFADAAGNFLQAPAPDTAPEDPFAELSLFYHTDRGLRYFALLGVAELSTRPLTVVSNLMRPSVPADDASAPLVPLAGAYYSPSESLYGAANGITGPALWFGQGPVSDYAYDADVIYHELLHAIVDDRIGLALWFHADEQGLVGSPAALNEAVADYFAAVLTGDPRIGEYAAPNLRPGLDAYRSLDNDARCPNDLSGEAHYDSAVISGALWTVREAAADAERAALDQAVLDTTLALPNGDVGFEDWLFALLDTLHSSAPPLAELLSSELIARGLLPRCERVLDWRGAPLRSGDELRSDSAFVAPGRSAAPWGANGRPPPIDFAPGIFQTRIELPDGASTLEVDFDTLGNEATPVVLARFGETPIRFRWDTASVELDAMASPKWEGAWRSVLAVPSGASTAHVMIANAGDLAFSYRDLTLIADDDSADDGCACAAARRTTGPSSALAALALLAGCVRGFGARRPRRTGFDRAPSDARFSERRAR